MREGGHQMHARNLFAVDPAEVFAVQRHRPRGNGPLDAGPLGQNPFEGVAVEIAKDPKHRRHARGGGPGDA